MKIEDYEKSGRTQYAKLARVVEDILRHALQRFDGVASVPQTQSRAKDPASLRLKLTTRGLFDTTVIEDDIKDLAGCRIIFYTATDLERFRQSDLWRQNFDVDWEASKTHFPRTEDASVDELYQGIHYVVRLNADRTKLVEYAELAGLRCEIQLQTILNHAWSETSHDVLYKAERVEGFGTRQYVALRKRFAKVMRDHLMSAGYEMQKIQEDAERLRAGRAVFDGAPLQRLGEASDNNERSDILEKIKVHLLPGLDDVSVHLKDIRSAVEAAIVKSRTTPVVARGGSMGGYRGAKPIDVAKHGLEILDALRYGYVDDAFQLLARLWQGATEPDEKKAIETSIERLAKYSIPIWNQVGAGVQLTLTDELVELGAERRALIRPVVLLVCRAALGSEMNHSEATSFNTITFSKATVGPHETLVAARRKAITLGLEALAASDTSKQWRESWNCLWSGTQGGIGGTKDASIRKMQFELMRELCSVVEKDRTRIPYDVLQEIEENLYWAHRRLGRKKDADSEKADEREPLEREIQAALVGCRDALNCDTRYVAYKTLVGFRTVLIEEWDGEIDVVEKERRRGERIAAYAEAVTAETRDYWLRLIVDCAATESDDGATFPPLTKFFNLISEQRPRIALDLLLSGGVDVERFAPAFLPPLTKSTARAETLVAMTNWLAAGRSAAPLGRSLLLCDEAFPQLIADTGARVIAAKDAGGCYEIAHAALKHGDDQNGLWTRVLIPSVSVLNGLDNGAFASSFLMRDPVEAKLEELPEPAVKAILDNFVCCREIGYPEQKKLGHLVLHHEELVWCMFEARLQAAETKSWEDRYEAVPEHWHGLEEKLRADVASVYDRVSGWRETADGTSRWNKAEFLARLYHDRGDAFIEGMISVVRRDGAAAIPFICEVLRHFEGSERLDPISLAMVEVAGENEEIAFEIRRVIEATGMTSGEFGRADALDAKAKRVSTWLEHPSTKVQAFARDFIDDLDKMVIEERRRGTERHERRKRDFDDPE